MLKQTFLTVLVLLACWVALMEGLQTSSHDRCSCKGSRMSSVIMNRVAKIEFYMRGSTCSQDELIVIFRNGQKRCLNLDEDQGRRIHQAIMYRNNVRKGSSN
ncbi:growth-regulated alpha protein-like [Pantherophis guttatus]|uniref:Growth-regulated alpha protein-like n=1 Tax=Pantherophis guttatus TaxID=94885 RepID=A0A6P9D5X9_PANGU|nr:growth-regulated alpha protein-like [Pantherophis guttatus]